MNILNNGLTTMSLGSLNKNISQAANRLAKLASGAKINGAGDGASDYAIAQKMQVRIRSLDQDSENVHNGMTLLNVAMGGVQEQLDLMKYVKERVLDAANDTNTDLDRMTIQNEINSCFETIDQIACETADYNKRKVLLGGNHYDWMVSWQINEDAELTPDSDLGIIPDVYDTLDGVEGPFDLFDEYKVETADIDILGIPGTFSGGQYGNPNHITVDFSPYTNAAFLNNVGFSVGGKKYVLSTDPDAIYAKEYTKIDISGCQTTEDAANKAAAETYSEVTASANGSIVTFATTRNIKASTSNATTVTGTGYTGYTQYNVEVSPGQAPVEAQEAYDEEVPIYLEATVTIDSTGIFSGKTYLSGGADAFNPYPDDVDSTNTPGTDAFLQRNILSANDGTGFVINRNNKQLAKIVLVNGNDPLEPYIDDDNIEHPNVYKIGKLTNWSGSLGGLSVNISSGIITFTGKGAAGNSYYITDGFTDTCTTQEQVGTKTVHHNAISGSPGIPPVYEDITYEGVTPLAAELNGTTIIDNQQDGTDATSATYTIDLSSYVGDSNASDLEALIAELYGHSITYLKTENTTASYEFIDSGILGLGTESKFSGATVKIDLNNLRTAVANGTDIATATANLLANTLTRSELVTDGSNITGIKLTAAKSAESGNTESISAMKGTLRSYHINFDQYLSANNLTLPDDLYGKGFRVYCPTDSKEWFNFVFVPHTGDSDNSDYRPESGTDSLNIKSLLIDVSQVTDATSFVSAIYEQAAPILTGAVTPEYGQNTNYNHHLRIAANLNSGELILYDDRQRIINYPVDNYKYNNDLQEAGEKIADGVYDNITVTAKELSCEDIVIHNTDKANMNIHLKIPRTTIDHVLGFDSSKTDLSSFNVLTKKNRDYLLGNKTSRGVLDRGIQYLTDAQTLLGAQYRHLESASDNITVTHENTIQSESVITDANMAKEAMEHAKYQILTQSSQAMLAQANQVSSTVLNLLQ